MKKFYTYIIYSETKDIYYKGFSENPDKRVLQHNQNKGRYTKNGSVLKSVYGLVWILEV